MKICWDNLEKLKYNKKVGKWYNNNITFIYKDSCKNCGEPFLAQIYSKGLFCDSFCYIRSGENNPHFGKTHTEETKNKISKVHKGIKLSDEHKRKISENSHPFIGKKHPSWKDGYNKKNIPLYDTYASQLTIFEHSRRNEKDQNILEVKCDCGKWFVPTRTNVTHRIGALNGLYSSATECRFYCSAKCKQECPIYNRKKYQVGHPKSNKSQYSREVQPELRQLVFKRDNFTCQKCELHQDELDVGLHCHHLTGVEINPIESADIDNCITLCKECHKQIHKNICPINTMRRKKCKEEINGNNKY